MARRFDDTDDQINFGTYGTVNNLAAFTASAIMRITSTRSTEKMIFAKMNSSHEGKMYLFQSNLSGRQNSFGAYVTTDGTSGYSASVSNVLTLNTWFVVVSSWAGAGNAPQLFICSLGGAMAEVTYAQQDTPTGSFHSDAGASLRIAARDPLDYFADADLAEVGLWDRVLSSSERAQLGLGYAPICLPNGLVAYAELFGNGDEYMRPASSSGTLGTMTGTTQIAHPPNIRYPISGGTFAGRCWNALGGG